jgi:hypothetical protein
MRAPASIGGTRGAWSHLIADTSDELVSFAAALKLRESWIQFPGTFREHFDVTENVRNRAISMGAIPISMRQAGEIFRGRVFL